MVEVKNDFQETEVGVIPVDWEICTLDDATYFLDGQRRPIKSSDREKINGVYPYYGASGIIDYVNDFIFDDNLILLGEDGENILSRNLPLAFQVEGKIWVNNHAHVMKPKDDFNITFLTAYLESLDYSLLNSGTAQPKLNKQSCLNIKVIKPTLAEQKAIATALSDVDALISNLEKLIAKKKAIKQGAMQQLLTGKKRLPGFEQKKGFQQTEIGEIPLDWSVANIGSQCQIFGRIGFRGYTVNDIVKEDQGAITLSPSNIVNGQLVLRKVTYLSWFKYEESPEIKIYNGDILLVKTGSTYGKTALVRHLNKKATLNPQVIVLKKTKCDNRFLGYLMGFPIIQNQIESAVVGGAIPTLSQEQVSRFKLPLPSNIDEQKAIAATLSDMDTEIEGLVSKKVKAQQIKQGMMQELLTGKTRLV